MQSTFKVSKALLLILVLAFYSCGSANKLKTNNKEKISQEVTPQLTAKYKVLEDETRCFVLNWERNDTSAVGYKLYVNFPPDTALRWESFIPLITTNSFTYKDLSYDAEEYWFQVVGVNSNNFEVDTSNIFKALSGSEFLPNFSISEIETKDKDITIHWLYDAIPDLKGFRVYIYQKGKLLRTDDLTDKFVRSKTLKKMPKGTYHFRVEAESIYGVKSETTPLYGTVVK